MFQLVLMLHVTGALVTIAALVFGAGAALIRKGNIAMLKTAFTWLSTYEIASGAVMVLLRPSVSALSAFCVGGLALMLVFWAVYILADRRIPQQAVNA